MIGVFRLSKADSCSIAIISNDLRASTLTATLLSPNDDDDEYINYHEYYYLHFD